MAKRAVPNNYRRRFPCQPPNWADRGRYPDSLAELATRRYLREVPEDPLTGKRDTWIELPPPADSAWQGTCYDVRSGAAGRAADGRLYADW